VYILIPLRQHLNISDVTGLDTYQYRAMVTGTSPCAAVPSDAAILTVNTISFSVQPASQTICSNSGVAFTVATTGGTPTTYNWQYRSSAAGTFADISGANTDTYTITSGLTSANTGNQYRCVVNKDISPLNSAVATLTVNDLPAFSTSLASQTVCTSAANVTFDANATGTGLSYQWEVSTNGTTWTPISGATSATYTITNPANALNGNQYHVIVSGTAPCSAVTSSAATLTVTQVAVTASSASICIGAPVTLTATFAGAPDYATSSWTSTTGSGAATAISGNSATVTPTAAGTYVYTFASNGTCPFTKTVSVTVNALPNITSATATPATVCSGATINLAAASVPSANGNASIGAGASTSSSSGASMFPGTYGGAKTQFIIKASELSAAGLVAGNITSLNFEATTAFNGYEGFALNIGHTTAAVAAMPMITSGLTQVYSGSGTNGAYATTIGVNTLAFSTPFNWDGTSNIVLSFCWAKNPTATSTTSTTVKQIVLVYLYSIWIKR